MKSDAQFQYVRGQSRPGFPTLLAEYEAQSAQAIAAGSCELDLRYGPWPRQTFDFFSARGTPRATLIYFHAGYWQSRDKSTFRFIAPAFTAAGLHVALVNYPLCPEVSLPELVEAAKACVEPIGAHARKSSGSHNLPLILSGHSAGAHISLEIAMAQDRGIAGVIAMSGIYDLSPLVDTSLNDKLRLDSGSATACSPLHRVRANSAPALIVVGADETPAFLDQSQRFHAAWIQAGNRGSLHVAPDADHFVLLRQFSTFGKALFNRALEVADL